MTFIRTDQQGKAMAKKAASEKKQPNRQTSNFMLSIPNDIRERMRTFDRIPWSAIAVETFVEAMNEKEYRVKPIDYGLVRLRLIKSRFKSESGSFQMMYYLAMNWAADKATYEQLANLAAFRDKHKGKLDQLCATDPLAHAKVAGAILGTDDEKAITDFWQSLPLHAKKMPTNKPEFKALPAFVYGALEVFDRVGV
jgi:hypothetical protein